MLFPKTASPLEISMALHYRCRPTQYPERSIAVDRIHAAFLERGYIRFATPADRLPEHTEYVGTEALRVWADALCAVPRPRKTVRWECTE